MTRYARTVLPLVILAATVRAQQAPPQSLAALKLAPDLQATLWASEPMLANPTNLTVDERGRVWVLEGTNYRRASRKLPDLRPAGDRIVILEDTDFDGKADRSTVFDQGPHLRVPLGIAVLGDKVYVSQSPDLIVYTKDASDAIVRKDVLLTGFAGVDHDHGLHAVVFGPDGRLYFNHGNVGFDVTDRSGRRFLSQGTGANTRPAPGYYEGVVLRMNPDGTNLEILGQNFRNPYEVAVDSFGSVFQTDNDDDGNAQVRLLYNMEGGNYGFRGPLNKSWQEDRGSHWHEELPGVAPVLHRIGSGSPCGLTVYEGALLPAKYRGQLLHADAGRRTIAGFTVSPAGAGFTARGEDLLSGGDDTWSRPTDVAVAPDGALFVSDWYDPGVGGHQMGDPDGSRGRIYRLAPARNTPRRVAVDVSSDNGLTAALGSPNESVRYLAHTALAARREAAAPVLQRLWRQQDPVVRARALWLLGGLGAEGSSAIQQALQDSDARFRILGLRVARLNGADPLSVARPLLRDRSPQVRREIALMMRDATPARMLPPYLQQPQTQPTAAWLDAFVQLADQYDGKDRWYLEALNIAARGHEDAIYARLQKDRGGLSPAALGRLVWGLRPKTALPDLTATLNNGSAPAADRILAIETIAAMQWPEAARALESFITSAAAPADLADRAFTVYSRQLFGLWSDARTSPALPAVMERAFATPATQLAAVTVAETLEGPQYLDQLLELARSAQAAPEVRTAAIDVISAKRDLRHLEEFKALAADGPTPVRVAAVRAVAALGETSTESWAREIVVSTAPNEVRAEAMRLLGRTVAGLTAILDLAEAKQLPVELRTLASTLTNFALPPPAVRRAAPQSPVAIRVNRTATPTDPAYAAIRQRAATVLPLPSAKVIPTAFELEFNYVGNAGNGRKVFDTDGGCAACHSLGGARKLGPDLSTIGAKYGRQAMLDHIVIPSDAIGPEYVMTVFTLKSGEQVQGLVVEENADRIVVSVAPDQNQRLAPSAVASRQQVRVSPMPEGLLSNLAPQQIADLLEFLTGLK